MAGGLLWGVAVALVLSLWVTIIYLVGGSEPFLENGTTYGETVLLYVAAGVLVGVLFGLARPWIRGHWSAAVFGFVGGCMLFSLISLAAGGYDPVAVLVCAAAVVPFVGWRYWSTFG